MAGRGSLLLHFSLRGDCVEARRETREHQASRHEDLCPVETPARPGGVGLTPEPTEAPTRPGPRAAPHTIHAPQRLGSVLQFVTINIAGGPTIFNSRKHSRMSPSVSPGIVSRGRRVCLQPGAAAPAARQVSAGGIFIAVHEKWNGGFKCSVATRLLSGPAQKCSA